MSLSGVKRTWRAKAKIESSLNEPSLKRYDALFQALRAAMKQRKAGGRSSKSRRNKTLRWGNAPATARQLSTTDKETNVARLRRESETLDQLAATSEVLKLISSLAFEKNARK